MVWRGVQVDQLQEQLQLRIKEIHDLGKDAYSSGQVRGFMGRGQDGP